VFVARYLAALPLAPKRLLEALNLSALMAGGAWVLDRLQRHCSNEPMQATCIDGRQSESRDTRPMVQAERNQKHDNEERTLDGCPGNMSILTFATANAVQGVAKLT